MASFETTAFISQIKYLPNSVIVYLDEFHKGYKNSDGTIVDDRYVQFKTVWKPYFRKYINDHFSQGMLVQVKGEVLPYAVENQNIVAGYSILGHYISIASYPRYNAKQEIKMIKESQLNSDEQPDLDSYNQPDF